MYIAHLYFVYSTLHSLCAELKVFEADTEEVYFTGIDVRGSSVRVSTELLRTVGNGTRPVSVASVYYRDMTGLLPGALLGGNDSVLASSVLSTSLQCGDRICDTADIELSQLVIISLPHSTNIPVSQCLCVMSALRMFSL